MHRFEAIPCTLVAALLCACALPPAPDDAFYGLEVDAPVQVDRTPLLPGILEIDPFRADPLTSGRAMLYRDPRTPARVHRHPYTFWMEAPPTMLQRQVAGYLRGARVAEKVITPNVGAKAGYVLAGTITRMEQIWSDEPAVRLELELSLVERESRDLLFHGLYAEELPMVGRDAAGAVDAFGRALSSILEHFVADLEASLDSRPQSQSIRCRSCGPPSRTRGFPARVTSWTPQ